MSPEEKKAYDRARLKARMLGNVGGSVLEIVCEDESLVQGDGQGGYELYDEELIKVAVKVADKYVEQLLKRCGL